MHFRLASTPVTKMWVKYVVVGLKQQQRARFAAMQILSIHRRGCLGEGKVVESVLLVRECKKDTSTVVQQIPFGQRCDKNYFKVSQILFYLVFLHRLQIKSNTKQIRKKFFILLIGFFNLLKFKSIFWICLFLAWFNICV